MDDTIYLSSSFIDPEMFGPHRLIVHLDYLQRHAKTHRKTLGAASLYVNTVYITQACFPMWAVQENLSSAKLKGALHVLISFLSVICERIVTQRNKKY